MKKGVFFRKGTVFIIIGLLLIAAAGGLTAYNFWQDERAGRVSADILQRLETMVGSSKKNVDVSGYRLIRDDEGNVAGYADRNGVPLQPGDIEYPDYMLDPLRALPTVTIDGRIFAGIINIPRIDRKFPVFAQWSYTDLRDAPCLYSGSPYTDDMVICAHNYIQHFGRISNLRVGDRVIFTDMDGNVFDYGVSEIENLRSGAVDDMTDGDGWDLSLFTCNMSGNARITVRCVRS